MVGNLIQKSNMAMVTAFTNRTHVLKGVGSIQTPPTVNTTVVVNTIHSHRVSNIHIHPLNLRIEEVGGIVLISAIGGRTSQTAAALA